MAVATRTETLDNIGTATVAARIPDIIDNFFGSNPLLARLLQRDGGNGTHVVLDGGKEIRQPYIYTDLNGGSFRDLDTFNTNRKENTTELVFPWSQYYVNITVSGLDSMRNSGGKKVYDHVNHQMDVAVMTAGNLLGTDIFLDGTGNNSKALVGLLAGISDVNVTATYGGITRSATADTPGNAILSTIDTTGGTFSLSLMNTMAGNATVGREKPDLYVTTQSIWNSWWERAQPAQRFDAGDSRNQMANIGFDTIRFNGGDVVVDSHSTSGVVWALNTKWIKLFVHTDRNWDFTGWKYPSNQDAAVGQILFGGQLVVQGPRLQSYTSNVT